VLTEDLEALSLRDLFHLERPPARL
jgi:hypothetical protein